MQLARWSEEEKKQIADRLMMRRDEISKSAENPESQPPPSERCTDALDYASRSTIQRVLFAIKNRRREKTRQIEEAIQRLADGEFGICTECDEEISNKRIEKLPETELCLDCQRAEEDRAFRLKENPGDSLPVFGFSAEDDRERDVYWRKR